MMYLGLTIDFGNLNEEEKRRKKLNQEYEGKGLDQSAYADFWEDFSATNRIQSGKNKRGSSTQQSNQDSSLPSIDARRTSVQPIVNEDDMFLTTVGRQKQAQRL